MAFKGSRTCKPLPHASQKEQVTVTSSVAPNAIQKYYTCFTVLLSKLKDFIITTMVCLATQFRALELDQKLAYTTPMLGIVQSKSLELELYVV